MSKEKTNIFEVNYIFHKELIESLKMVKVTLNAYKENGIEIDENYFKEFNEKYNLLCNKFNELKEIKDGKKFDNENIKKYNELLIEINDLEIEIAGEDKIFEARKKFEDMVYNDKIEE